MLVPIARRIGQDDQLRSVFDEGQLGMVLIGMPDFGKRIARFLQF